MIGKEAPMKKLALILSLIIIISSCAVIDERYIDRRLRSDLPDYYDDYGYYDYGYSGYGYYPHYGPYYGYPYFGIGFYSWNPFFYMDPFFYLGYYGYYGGYWGYYSPYYYSNWGYPYSRAIRYGRPYVSRDQLRRPSSSRSPQRYIRRSSGSSWGSIGSRPSISRSAPSSPRYSAPSSRGMSGSVRRKD
jgi:hypothetical protein